MREHRPKDRRRDRAAEQVDARPERYSAKVYGEDDTLRRMERASAPDVQIEPLDDWLTVSPASDEHETRTGLIIPSAGEVPVKSGIVLAIGDEVQGVSPGDKVLFPRAAGMDVRLGGEPVLIVRRGDSSRASASSLLRSDEARPAARRRGRWSVLASDARDPAWQSSAELGCQPHRSLPMSTVTDLPDQSQTAPAGPAPGAAPQRQPPRRGGWRGGRIVPFVVVALLGGAAGGAIVAAFGDSGSTKPTTTSAVVTPAAAAVASATPVTAGGTKTIEQIYTAAAPGVVQVNQGGAEGSGFVLDRQGDVVTNAHVVTNGGAVTVSFSNDDRVPARVVGVDNSTDIALLKVTLRPRPRTAPLGDSARLQVGDGVVAIGNPFGFDRTPRRHRLGAEPRDRRRRTASASSA